MVLDKDTTSFFGSNSCSFFPVQLTEQDFIAPIYSSSSFVMDQQLIYLRIYLWNLLLIPLVLELKNIS